MAKLDKWIPLILILLITFPLFGGESPTSRILKVKLALDESYPPRDSSQKGIEEAILTASRHFEKEFDLKFTLAEVSSWQSDKGLKSFDELFIDMQRKVDRGECHIVIGLTARRLLRGELLGGASYRSGSILIRWTSPQQDLGLLLTHELGHLFGAVHTKNRHSVMNMNPDTSDFDRENAESERPYAQSGARLSLIQDEHESAQRRNGKATHKPRSIFLHCTDKLRIPIFGFLGLRSRRCS